MIRAAALSYAIVFVLIVGLISSGILYISSTQKVLEVNYTSEENVIFDSYFAQQFGKSHVIPGDSSVYFHVNGDTSKIFHQVWGAYNVIFTKTFKKNHHNEKASMTGWCPTEALPCLYLAGTSGSIKITGSTRLEGVVFAPNKKVERAYIGGENYKFDSLVFGTIEQSAEHLPSLLNSIKNLTKESFSENRNLKKYFPHDSIYSFSNKATIYSSLDAIVLNTNISGNVIIHSFDSIFIKQESQLTDVILIAPKVRFEEGFKGNLQVLGHESVVLEKGVQLVYPSAIVLNELKLKDRNILTNRTVLLEEESMVCGGILITSQEKDFRRPPILIMKENSVLGGIGYINGAIDPKGEIIGHLYTETIRLNLGGSVYANHLLNNLILSKKLPSNFCIPNWLAQENKKRIKTLKWL